MTVRYYIRFNYYDTIENGRVEDSVFLDLPREITSNDDLNSIKEQLNLMAASYIPNAKRLRISDYRLEGVSETSLPMREPGGDQWKERKARA